MQYEGVLTKMQTESGAPIQYYLVFENSFLHMNQLMGKPLELSFLGYQCLACSKRKKVWRQGLCWDCFTTSPAAGEWIIKPELCTAHLGIEDRDLEYEKRVQLQPHIVYLALCTEVKVGVTRKTQIPTRWIDQGACSAIPLVEVPNRYLAGISEIALKNFYTDKTNWKKMLLQQFHSTDLTEEYTKALRHLPDEVKSYCFDTLPEVMSFEFPSLACPSDVKTLYLDKAGSFSGTLVGIRGQYLIFEDGTVLNIRNAEGLMVRLSA